MIQPKANTIKVGGNAPAVTGTPGQAFSGASAFGSAALPVIDSTAQVGAMYYDALTRDYDQYFQDIAGGMNSYADVGSLSSQEYQKEGFQFGDIVKGLGAGASAGAAVGAAIGSAAPGVGTAIGAGVGVLAGAGSAIIKNARQKKAMNEFEQQKKESLMGAINRNRTIDYRKMAMKNMGIDINDQLQRFY